MSEQMPPPHPLREEQQWLDDFWDLNKILSGSSHTPTENERKDALKKADDLAAEIYKKHGKNISPSLVADIAHSFELAKEHGLEGGAQNLRKFSE